MDSFYDTPRCAPTPTEFKNFIATPVVPEVSIICPSKTPQKNFVSYNNWGIQQKLSNKVPVPNKENIVCGLDDFDHPVQFITGSQNTSQFMKKQVRFESPILHQKQLPTYEKCVPNNDNITKYSCNGNKDLAQQKLGLWAGNKFEQIYMANIPKRELDLSVIDLPKHNKTSEHIPVTKNKVEDLCSNKDEGSLDLESTNKENLEPRQSSLPRTYREFLDSQKKSCVKIQKPTLNDSVTDIFNYKKNKLLISENKEKPHNESNNEYSKYNSPKHNMFPAISNKQFQNTQEVSSQNPLLQRSKVTPIHNAPVKHNIFENRQYHEGWQTSLSPKCDSVTQTSNVFQGTTSNKISENVQKENKSDEPSNKELLKIIAQQNEQLLVLQKQVALLLNRDQSQTKLIEAPKHYINEKLKSSTQNENFRQDTTPKKRGMSKFSIDLMTSFEVAIRPQHNKYNFVNMEPKIQEITESESLASDLDRDEKVIEQSLYLPDPVRETCPSPEPSININMQDYDSSDEEATVSEIGVTFYQNLMGQVNNILKKAHLQTKEDLATRDDIRMNVIPQNTKEKKLNKVKEATVKHLRSIGVHLDPTSESEESTSSGNDSKSYTPSEISFAIKQMLMKYLPDDQLGKVANRAPDKPKHMKRKPSVILPTRPEFSFASVQYMKKYNLIPSNETNQNERMYVTEPNQQGADNSSNPKILDLTALKMQPKLL